MGGDMSRIHCIALEPAADPLLQAALQAAKFAALLSFDVKDTQCTSEVDRERLLTMIEASMPGGIDGFNVRLRQTLAQINERTRGERAAAAQRSSARSSTRRPLRSSVDYSGGIDGEQSSAPTCSSSIAYPRSPSLSLAGLASGIASRSPSRVSPCWVAQQDLTWPCSKSAHALPAGCKRHRSSSLSSAQIIPSRESAGEIFAVVPESILARLALPALASSPIRGVVGARCSSATLRPADDSPV
jgi:hypothetical protein